MAAELIRREGWRVVAYIEMYKCILYMYKTILLCIVVTLERSGGLRPNIRKSDYLNEMALQSTAGHNNIIMCAVPPLDRHYFKI
jgi:hypothetical protein